MSTATVYLSADAGDSGKHHRVSFDADLPFEAASRFRDSVRSTLGLGALAQITLSKEAGILGTIMLADDDMARDGGVYSVDVRPTPPAAPSTNAAAVAAASPLRSRVADGGAGGRPEGEAGAGGVDEEEEEVGEATTADVSRIMCSLCQTAPATSRARIDSAYRPVCAACNARRAAQVPTASPVRVVERTSIDDEGGGGSVQSHAQQSIQQSIQQLSQLQPQLSQLQQSQSQLSQLSQLSQPSQQPEQPEQPQRPLGRKPLPARISSERREARKVKEALHTQAMQRMDSIKLNPEDDVHVETETGRAKREGGKREKCKSVVCYIVV